MNILCVPVGPLQANCYLVSDDSGTAVAIDPGGEADRLSEIAEERGLRITHILLTHGHFDHLAGAADLAKLVGASVGCSAATAPMLRDPDKYIPFPGVCTCLDPATWEQLLRSTQPMPLPTWPGQLRLPDGQNGRGSRGYA